MFNDDDLWDDRRPERVNHKNKAKETNRSLKSKRCCGESWMNVSFRFL